MDQKIEKILALQGTIAPPFTAYDDNGSINVDIIPKYAEYLSQNGVCGVFVNGTSGDSLSLSVSERKLLTESWIKAGKKCLKTVMIHVGSNCFRETQELASHAEANNADAIAVLPPTYYKPNNNDELINYLAGVANAAPNTPLIYYHIPFMSGVNVSLSSFVGEAQKRIPSFCGAKYTSTDLKDLVVCQVKFGQTFKLILGCEELFLAVLPYGINTTIGITHNMMPSLGRQVLKYYNEGNVAKAREEQNKMVIALQQLTQYGSLFQVLRKTMNVATPINVGNPRPPMFPLKEDSLKNLEQEIQKCQLS